MNTHFTLEKQLQYEKALAEHDDFEGVALLQGIIFDHALQRRTPVRQSDHKTASVSIAQKLRRKISTLKKYCILTLISLHSAYAYKKATTQTDRILHYMIQKNTLATRTDKDDLCAYDKRSHPVLKTINPSDTLNIIHAQNMDTAYETRHTIHNPIYFEYAAFFLLPFVYIQAVFRTHALRQRIEKPFEISFREEVKFRARKIVIYWFFSILFGYIGPKNTLIIDDSRHTTPLRRAANRNGCKTIFYMHGRFNEHHIGLFHTPPDTYLMWSDYYESLYKHHYQKRFKTLNTQIIKVGAYHLNQMPPLTKKEKGKDVHLLLILEDNVDYTALIPFLDSAIKYPHLKLSFKAKNNNAPDALNTFIKQHDINIHCDLPLYETCKEQGVDIICGTHSTALLESWLMGIPSIILGTNLPYADHMIADNLCLVAKTPNDLKAAIDTARKISPQEIQKFQHKLWSWHPSSPYTANVIADTLESLIPA